MISNCKYHKSIHTRTWNITWEYKERWNFLASSNWDISPSITLVIFTTSGEPTISRNLREMIVSRHSFCLGAPKETNRKEKHLCDKNLFKVDFVNHAAQLTFSGSSSLRLAKDPSPCKAFSPGICGKSCSRGPTASFSSLLLPQTNASYLQVRQKITEVYTY